MEKNAGVYQYAISKRGEIKEFDRREIEKDLPRVCVKWHSDSASTSNEMTALRERLEVLMYAFSAFKGPKSYCQGNQNVGLFLVEKMSDEVIQNVPHP